MTAPHPDNPVSDGVHSVEVRWILAGPLERSMLDWFGRFPVETESREDVYLVDPHLGGLSVKVRGCETFDVKKHLGSPGTLEVAGPVRGRMESWQKWSFPVDSSGAAPAPADSAGWRPVRKRRRISLFSLASGRFSSRVRGPEESPGCAVELTEVLTRDEWWWTLGFEATGGEDLFQELSVTADLVFAEPLPEGVELSWGTTRSYAEWLRRNHGTQGPHVEGSRLRSRQP
jgi:hypothetical protein